MKIRNGFVSNSSSCSFLIVGILGWSTTKDLTETIKEMAKADGCKEMGWGGYSIGRTLRFLGGENGYDEQEYEPAYVGIEIADELNKNNKTVGELKQEFLEKAKALGFDIPEERVELLYGEVSSE